MNKKDFLEYEGTVIRKLPDGYFKIELLEFPAKMLVAGVANRLKSVDRRWRRIKEGDKVCVEIPLGDLTKGRIIKLLH